LLDVEREINRYYGRRICHTGNIISNLAERGNTATTSHTVALADSIQSRRIRSGECIVFGITGSGVTIGTAIYSLDDLPDRLLRTEPSMAGRNGNAGAAQNSPASTQQVRIASIGLADQMAPSRDSLSLGALAASDALRDWGHDAGDLGLLLHTGVYRTEFFTEPAVAAQLAGRLKLNDAAPADSEKKTLAFDILNGPVGFLNACQVATRFIQADRCRAAMVVAAEIENNTAEGGHARGGLSEGGSALVLERCNSGEGFGRFLFEAFPHYRDSFVTETGHDANGTFLHWRLHPQYLDQLLESISQTVTRLLEAEGMSLADVNLVMAPQISPIFLQRLAARLGIESERVVDACCPQGDWFTSSLPRALWRARASGLIVPGDLALLITAGSGIQVGCATYRL
jgi:3-oxoacyl-[acyl-carrier-protein] synthase III